MSVDDDHGDELDDSARKSENTATASRGEGSPDGVVASGTTGRRAPRWLGVGLAGCLGLAVVAIGVNANPWFGPRSGVAVFSGKAGREVARQNADIDAAQQAACEVADRLLSYDYRKVDEFFERMQEVAAGWFGEGLVSDREGLRNLFLQAQVVSRAERTACTVEMIGEEAARVRVQGTQIMIAVAETREAAGQEQTNPVDVYIDLRQDRDGWKVIELNPVRKDQPTPPTPPAPAPAPGDPPPAMPAPAVPAPNP